MYVCNVCNVCKYVSMYVCICICICIYTYMIYVNIYTYTTLYYTTLHYATLHYITLHYIHTYIVYVYTIYAIRLFLWVCPETEYSKVIRDKLVINHLILVHPQCCKKQFGIDFIFDRINIERFEHHYNQSWYPLVI